MDELNSALGCALACGLSPELEPRVRRIQSELFNVGGELCLLGEPAPAERAPLIAARHVEALERECDLLNENLGVLANFILPGGCAGAAWLHLARTICRRAERQAVALRGHTEVPADVVRYLNRLSDLLFIMARFENRARGVPDLLWDTSV